MPILLDTQHIYSPGHGQPDVSYSMVEVVGMDVHTIKDVMLLTMQYGDRINNKWIGGIEEPHKIRIRNISAVVAEGFDQNGEWKKQEVVPANPRFADLIAGALTQAAGSLLWGEVQYALYVWLLTHGPEDAEPGQMYYYGTPVF